MIEIIPNWHPIFVHFTVALLSLAVCFHIVQPFFKEGIIKQHFFILARWNLWIGTGISLITVITGWFAYNSVVHDTPSHAAMTEHRNWALITISLFILLTVWSFRSEINNRQSGKAFLVSLFIAGILLFSTAWHGAEIVYRYGLGVMSLPQVEDDGHSHEHGDMNKEIVSEENEVIGNHVNNSITQSEQQYSSDQGSSDIENIKHGENAENDIEKAAKEIKIQGPDDHSGHQH